MLPWWQPLFFLLLVLSVLHFIENVDYCVALIYAKADQPTSRWKRFHSLFIFLMAKYLIYCECLSVLDSNISMQNFSLWQDDQCAFFCILNNPWYLSLVKRWLQHRLASHFFFFPTSVMSNSSAPPEARLDIIAELIHRHNSYSLLKTQELLDLCSGACLAIRPGGSGVEYLDNMLQLFFFFFGLCLFFLLRKVKVSIIESQILVLHILSLFLKVPHYAKTFLKSFLRKIFLSLASRWTSKKQKAPCLLFCVVRTCANHPMGMSQRALTLPL